MEYKTTQEIQALLRRGLIITPHARNECFKEKVGTDDIKETLLYGVAVADNSTRNDKSRAWNSAQHYSIFNAQLNLTVVFCESRESACLICTVFHGKAHDITSNPYTHKAKAVSGSCSYADRMKQLGRI